MNGLVENELAIDPNLDAVVASCHKGWPHPPARFDPANGIGDAGLAVIEDLLQIDFIRCTVITLPTYLTLESVVSLAKIKLIHFRRIRPRMAGVIVVGKRAENCQLRPNTASPSPSASARTWGSGRSGGGRCGRSSGNNEVVPAMPRCLSSSWRMRSC